MIKKTIFRFDLFVVAAGRFHDRNSTLECRSGSF